MSLKSLFVPYRTRKATHELCNSTRSIDGSRCLFRRRRTLSCQHLKPMWRYTVYLGRNIRDRISIRRPLPNWIMVICILPIMAAPMSMTKRRRYMDQDIIQQKKMKEQLEKFGFPLSVFNEFTVPDLWTFPVPIAKSAISGRGQSRYLAGAGWVGVAVLQ